MISKLFKTFQEKGKELSVELRLVSSSFFFLLFLLLPLPSAKDSKLYREKKSQKESKQRRTSNVVPKPEKESKKFLTKRRGWQSSIRKWRMVIGIVVTFFRI